MILLWTAFLALAQEAPEDALFRKCDSQIPWISDGVELADGSKDAPPAADRGALLERAKRQARERNRLILWYCMRVPGTHTYRAAALDTYARVALFTDPGLVDLVTSKFVPLRMACDEALSAATGLKFPGFIEPGFVVLSPDGRVVHRMDRLRTFNADRVRAALVAVLRGRPGYNAPAGESVEDLIRGGDDERAFERAAPDQKALILRRAGRFEEVLRLPGAPVQKGIALLGLRDFEGARRVLSGENSPEARYHLAACDWWTGKTPDGLWRKLVEEHPESPWAWRAAANLVRGRDGLRQGPLAHHLEDFSLPASGDPVPRAVDFLLRAQREDGSWSDARYAYGWAAYVIREKKQAGLLDPAYTSWPDRGLQPNVFMAVTALASWALLEWRDAAPARVDAALLRAETYLLDERNLAPGRCEECYAHAYRLAYFAAKRDVARMNPIVRRLAALQDREGFWGHEYPGAFATAAVVRCLTTARRAGAEVPEPLLRKAADALLLTRGEGGRQAYRREPGKGPGSEKNSMGRTASSELALFECGGGSLANVAAGVETYWRHRERLEAVRVCDNHADEELAGFFYFNSVFHTLEAALALGEPVRSAHARRFREQILAIPEPDGSFVDSHELGKSYGTAMALLILKRTSAQDELSALPPEEQPRKMLYRYLEAECAKALAERRKVVAAMKTPEDVARRQAELRAKFLAALGGLPERTPLNARVTGTLRGDGFTVDKVIFESRPGHHVTANLYLPEGKAPSPGVVFPLGHYGNPKPADEYQRACILLAKNGVAALSYDPIGQGERHQTMDGRGRPRAHGTSEHTLVDVGALLVGSCAAQQFVWDGMRALDYLQTRPEISPERLGCMGNSGGGTVTAYLMALDERVACAIPNCYITSQEKLFSTVGPQDGEANIPGQVAFGMGHPDYFLLRAPRPAQLSCPTRDYYDIEGAWDTFREAKQIYGILGHAERMDLFEYDDKHSISRPFREAGVRWMRRWLLGKDDAPVETGFPVFKEAELQCTASGHVLKDFKEKTAYDFTADRERELASKRGRLAGKGLLDDVRRRIAVGEPGKASRRPGVPAVRAVFETDPGIAIPALLFAPEKPSMGPRVLYAHGEGKSKEARPGGAIDAWVRGGHEVVAIDLRGMGETEPEPPHKGLVNFVKADWKEAYLGLNLRRPLLGQRVRDLLAVAAAIDEDGRGVHLIGVGAAAPAALHAAALDARFREVTLEGMVLSWSLVARTPVTIHQLTNVVPGALEAYDLPDLAAALAPRALTLTGSTDPAGRPVSPAEIDEAYAAARAAYAAAGARLTLRAGVDK